LEVIDISPHQARPASLVTARSFLVDRVVPDCEIVSLPGKQIAGGQLGHSRGAVTLRPWGNHRPFGRMRRRLAGEERTRRIRDRVVFDVRHRSPHNWAHWLTNHLPIVFRLAAAEGLARSEILLVTPADIPGYVRTAAELFGLEVLAADSAIEGEGVTFEVRPWTAVRAARAEWVSAPEVRAVLDAALAGGNAAPLPARIFLSRRKTRALSNEAEIERYLAARGYETIYPEDLAPADQIRLFREAEAIVAIHGAGLAPLLYVPPGGRLRQLVEILPVGHMSDAFRVIADQVGVRWIGVRGKIKPQYVAPAYRLDARFDAFSLDSFEVDVASLDLALEMIGTEAADA
jgi:capsular polysaccharide biosynthesis protein